MRHPIVLKVAALVLAAAAARCAPPSPAPGAAGAGESSGGPRADGVRRAVLDPRRTIADQLLPGDVSVEITRDEAATAASDSAMTQAQWLELAVQSAGEILVLDFTSVEPRVVDGGRRVRTMIDGVVVEPLKGALAPPPLVGDRRTFEIGGGDVTVNGVRVRFFDAVPYAAGQRFVVFLKDRPPIAGEQDSPSSVIVGTHPLLVEGGRLRGFPSKSDELTGVTIDQLRAAIQAAR